ncbi:zeta toxin family protein [Kitasatospora sp. NPDC087861]|uniref:zeta toxin family protein n=1 Tax=Kitasatospora sp. NPDC087861 TaxID=3364070 RepID=UPI0038268B01
MSTASTAGMRRASPAPGRTEAARLVKRVMRPGTVRLVGDNFKMFHPYYFDRLRDDPRGAR